jgi:N-acetyl-gamma-glutamyl-phosphate reductase
LGEIHQSLHQLKASNASVNFVPWRGDFTRGIFVSSTMDCKMSLEEANAIFEAYYQLHPFTIVANNQISMKQVVNTNKAVVYLEKQGNKLVVHSAIDNLLKGASGQAVQNMNILFGLDQTSGLQLKSSAF